MTLGEEVLQEIIEERTKVVAKKARQEGRAEGRTEKAQATVLRLLTRRIGKVPAKLKKQINSCTDLTQLDAWLDALADARSPEEARAIFTAPAKNGSR